MGLKVHQDGFKPSKFLEHLHPWAERQALDVRFEGLQSCTKFF